MMPTAPNDRAARLDSRMPVAPAPAGPAPAHPPAARGRLFALDAAADTPGGRLLSRVAPPLERLLRLDRLNDIYSRVRAGATGPGDARPFMRRVLDDLNVTWRVSDDDLARVPKSGPVVVVANHPFGAVEGILLADLLQSVRGDVKMMANFMLSRIPEIREQFIYVDPFGGAGSVRDNLKPVRESIRWLQGGGAMGVFPAGEVAHLDLRRREVTDPAWSRTVARIVRKARAPVLPVYFAGHNGALFNVLGLIHPRLRTAMLPRELLNKCGTEIEVRIGSLVPFRRLDAFGEDGEMMDYVRQRTFVLGHRPQPSPASAEANPAAGDTPAPAPAAPGGGLVRTWALALARGFRGGAKAPEAVIPAVAPEALAGDVARLPAEQLLVDADEYAVYHARASQMPNLLRELGRLREITYRATGEGTNKSLDLDRFDNWYEQLFVWHKAACQIVGAYRLGPVDRILADHGKGGLYTSTLFNFKDSLLDRLGPALEMGRSFVRQEYQRSYAPLLLLWKGIGRYVVTHPRYKMLFGPVSISNEYQSVSKQLMVQFLQDRHHVPEFAGMARARRPFRVTGVQGCDREAVRRVLKESDDVSDLVAEIEPDHKGIPVLLRQYLKLGARFFSFNIDAGFNDAVDALMLVDLTATDTRVLERYLGREGVASFRAHHGLGVPHRDEPLAASRKKTAR